MFAVDFPRSTFALAAAEPGSSLAQRARQALVVAVAAICYFAVRMLVDDRRTEALRHAAELIRVERAIGLFREPDLQAWALSHEPVGTIANWVYVWCHWPVILGVLIWLLIVRRAAFPLYRNALVISGALGLVVFATFPVAPPRLVDGYGFVDTIAVHSHSARVLQPASATNLYAALPSFHAGWNLLMAIAIVRQTRWRWLKLPAALMPAAMAAAVVMTANHYLVDLLAGMSVTLLGLWLAAALGRAAQDARAHDRRSTPPALLLPPRRLQPPRANALDEAA